MDKKYAIVIKGTEEFYPDPIYEDLEKAKKKVAYLTDYRTTHNMKSAEYAIETLTAKREAQHNDEWTRWCASMD